mgnify:CR=1 FL=1
MMIAVVAIWSVVSFIMLFALVVGFFGRNKAQDSQGLMGFSSRLLIWLCGFWWLRFW